MSKLIMVFDDAKEILGLYECILTDEGYRVSLHGWPTSLEQIVEMQPDLAIIDLLFNNEELGWQLIQQLRMCQATAHLPVILCSADSVRVKHLQEQLDEKKVRVIFKPFDVDALIKAVQLSIEETSLVKDFALAAE